MLVIMKYLKTFFLDEETVTIQTCTDPFFQILSNVSNIDRFSLKGIEYSNIFLFPNCPLFSFIRKFLMSNFNVICITFLSNFVLFTLFIVNCCNSACGCLQHFLINHSIYIMEIHRILTLRVCQIFATFSLLTSGFNLLENEYIMKSHNLKFPFLFKGIVFLLT